MSLSRLSGVVALVLLGTIATVWWYLAALDGPASADPSAEETPAAELPPQPAVDEPLEPAPDSLETLAQPDRDEHELDPAEDPLLGGDAELVDETLVLPGAQSDAILDVAVPTVPTAEAEQPSPGGLEYRIDPATTTEEVAPTTWSYAPAKSDRWSRRSSSSFRSGSSHGVADGSRCATEAAAPADSPCAAKKASASAPGSVPTSVQPD